MGEKERVEKQAKRDQKSSAFGLSFNHQFIIKYDMEVAKELKEETNDVIFDMGTKFLMETLSLTFLDPEGYPRKEAKFETHIVETILTFSRRNVDTMIRPLSCGFL